MSFSPVERSQILDLYRRENYIDNSELFQQLPHTYNLEKRSESLHSGLLFFSQITFLPPITKTLDPFFLFLFFDPDRFHTNLHFIFKYRHRGRYTTTPTPSTQNYNKLFFRTVAHSFFNCKFFVFSKSDCDESNKIYTRTSQILFLKHVDNSKTSVNRR